MKNNAPVLVSAIAVGDMVVIQAPRAAPTHATSIRDGMMRGPAHEKPRRHARFRFRERSFADPRQRTTGGCGDSLGY